MSADLFSPLRLGRYTLKNRVFMAPLTRGRADADGVPTPIMVDYYRQRATAGLIISEATPISPQGYGWAYAPGIYSDAQQEKWKEVTDAVHGKGGHIFLQLWHMGRLTHPDFHGGDLPVSASAVAATGKAHTFEGAKEYVTPRALDISELPGIVKDYAAAARRAVAAGFDGVEIHGANSYLLDQFLKDGCNRRTDIYGGSIENRFRLMREVVEAVAAEIGADRAGIRLSPYAGASPLPDSDPAALFAYVGRELSAYNLAYVHVKEALSHDFGARVTPLFRQNYDGLLVVNEGYDRETAVAAVADGQADAVAFGKAFIANPDLAERLKDNLPLNPPDVPTFYSRGEKGYTDYPLSRKAA